MVIHKISYIRLGLPVGVSSAFAVSLRYRVFCFCFLFTSFYFLTKYMVTFYNNGKVNIHKSMISIKWGEKKRGNNTLI